MILITTLSTLGVGVLALACTLYRTKDRVKALEVSVVAMIAALNLSSLLLLELMK